MGADHGGFRPTFRAGPAFEDGEPVNVTDFEFPRDEAENPGWIDSEETIRRLMSWICEDGNVMDVGRRSIVLSYLFRLPGAPRTSRELGLKLGVSHTHALRLSGICSRKLVGIQSPGKV